MPERNMAEPPSPSDGSHGAVLPRNVAEPAFGNTRNGSRRNFGSYTLKDIIQVLTEAVINAFRPHFDLFAPVYDLPFDAIDGKFRKTIRQYKHVNHHLHPIRRFRTTGFAIQYRKG